MINPIKYIGILIFVFSGLMQSCKKGEVPTLSTAEVSEIKGTKAICGGTIITEGSSAVLQRGVCWSKSPTPTISGNKTADGAGAGVFISNISGLEPVNIYYVRAYATNEAGTGYGMAMSFTTLGSKPLATVEPARNVTTTSAVLSGNVNPNYLSTLVTFEYGITTGYGQSINATPNQVSGEEAVNVTATITSLNPGTLYHFRIKVENSQGIGYSEDMVFTTDGQVPLAIIQEPTLVTTTTATINGVVFANFLSTQVFFEYGPTSAYGITVSAIPSIVTGTSQTKVIANITGLAEGTEYHYRIIAVNVLGATYSDDMSFSTYLVEVDGNIYTSVTIGTQVWMVENLKTTKYNDGTSIPNVTDQTTWANLTTPAYCWFNNSISNKEPYGALYNSFAVNTGKLCPVGWHVSTHEEWNTLSNYLGGAEVAGGKLKSAGTSYWASPNTGATNEVGFNALGSGYRGTDGPFLNQKKHGSWWTSSFVSNIQAMRGLIFDSAGILGLHPELGESAAPTCGLSVRCVKD